MAYKSPINYNIGGERLKISFTDPRVGLICQGFFHLSQIDDPGDYEIVFTEVDRRHLESYSSLEKLIPCCPGKETSVHMVLKERFHLFFLPEQKKLFSLYPNGIFCESEQQEGIYNLYYENTFNNEILPPNSSGVISTIYWFLECLGIFRLHAAYTEYEGIAIIFPGKGGTGKTTSALNVAMNGGSLYCDDQVFFREEREGRVEAYPSLKKIAITEETMEFFPELIKLKNQNNKRLYKYHFPIEEIRPASPLRTGVPEYVIFPFILNETDTLPRVERITSFEGFVTFLKGELMYPPVSPENRRLQLKLIQILSVQAKIFFCYYTRDMAKNFELFRDVILFERISENVIS